MADKDDPNWGHTLGLGLQVLVGVVLGLVVGRWVDRRFHLEPWGVLVCTALGLAGGMYSLIREGMKVNRD